MRTYSRREQDKIESKLHLKKDLQDVFGVKRILCLLPPSYLIIQGAFLYQQMVSISPEPKQVARASDVKCTAQHTTQFDTHSTSVAAVTQLGPSLCVKRKEEEEALASYTGKSIYTSCSMRPSLQSGTTACARSGSRFGCCSCVMT